MKDRLIVALDVDTFEQARSIVDELGDDVSIYKIGLAPFIGYGFKIIDYIKARNKRFFLDLKFFDIPNTVELAVYQSSKLGASMLSIHTIGTKPMIEAAIAGKKRFEDEAGFPSSLAWYYNFNKYGPKQFRKRYVYKKTFKRNNFEFGKKCLRGWPQGFCGFTK
jgi:hypothetical protein